MKRWSFLLVMAACGGRAPDAATSAPQPAATEAPELVALIAQFDAALAARPDDPVLLYQRASSGAEAGRIDESLAFLDRLDATGWDIPFGPNDLAALAAHPRFQAIAARIAARSTRVGSSARAFDVPGPELIPEGIAVDPATGRFFIGSIRKRTIVAIDPAGTSRPFVAERRDGLGAVLGMKVDGARGVLWATSFGVVAMEHFDAKADAGRSDVTAFALADGSRQRHVGFPAGGDPHQLNDLAVAADGTLYITDSVAGAVWRVPPDRDELEPLVAPGSLIYPNGIALASTGKLLVAHATGIAVVDPLSGAVGQLGSAPRVPLGGIDGLIADGPTLYAVQNGIGAPRLVAISLDAAGTQATALVVLDNDPANLELPTTSALYQGALFTIANAQLDALGPDGLRQGRPLHDPRIVRTEIPRGR